MLIKDMKTINVYNFNQNVVVVSTKHDSYVVEPDKDIETTTTLPLTMYEIVEIKVNSNAFKNGLLSFSEDIEKEMYEDVLHILNWEDLLKPDQIEDIILNPTNDKLQKILNIKDSGMFDKVRAVFARLKNTTNKDISMRVEQLIEFRYSELRRGIRTSSYVFTQEDIKEDSEDIKLLKEQNKMLQDQIDEMKRLFSNSQNNDNDASIKKVGVKRGRKAQKEE